MTVLFFNALNNQTCLPSYRLLLFSQLSQFKITFSLFSNYTCDNQEYASVCIYVKKKKNFYHFDLLASLILCFFTIMFPACKYKCIAHRKNKTTHFCKSYSSMQSIYRYIIWAYVSTYKGTFIFRFLLGKIVLFWW
jgi:hypothetical protein